jgi:hypothetical protein
LENNWADARVGFAILSTPRGEDGAAPAYSAPSGGVIGNGKPGNAGPSPIRRS